MIKHLQVYKKFIDGLKLVDINVAKPYDYVFNYKTSNNCSYVDSNPKTKQKRTRNKGY